MSIAEHNIQAKCDKKGVICLDNAIAIVQNIKELPLDDGEVRCEAFAFLFCRQGKAEIEVNAQTHRLKTNEAFVLRPHDLISDLMMSSNFQGSILVLSEESMRNLVGENRLWKAFFYFAKKPIIAVPKERVSLMLEYGQLLKNRIEMGKTPLHREIVSALLQGIIYESCECINQKALPISDTKVHGGSLLFRHFIDLLAGCRVKPRNISWYSDQLSVTPKYLSTVCKQVSGKTALEWISHYVAIDICNLLKNTDKPIKEIVNILHFSNISFFGTYCRRHFGMSPVAYRSYLRTQKTEQLV